jgi:hypothetical protein
MSAVPELCAELQPILAAELSAGNKIAYSHTQVGDDAVVIMLKKPFKSSHAAPAGVEFSEVNDPHWWLADYRCAAHRHRLACQFA